MIEVQGLTKYYGEHAAIRDLSFNINKGEVIGFLGLNGAGKSTTLRVLGCVLLPTAGHVRIDGLDLATQPHEVRKRIGFLPDVPPLYNEMTVGGYLAFVAQLRGVASADVSKRVREVEEKTALVDAHDQVVGTLSHGYRQRTGLAQAMVHNPQLLILDEPTSGLDPVQIVEMRKLIKDLRGQHTILLSSHILSEISQTCDRFLVINEGSLVAQGSEAELSQSSVVTVDIEIVGNIESAKTALHAVDGVKQVEVVRATTTDAGAPLLRVQAASELRPQLVRALVQANVDVLRVDRGALQLESIFMKLTQTRHA
ncbi:MAG TPA: ABC transporter ATP-binding protein [Polyangia bacterium]|nr:ABC transporter ATP-binding protein [Polyangia bacterium]HWE29900.1 ABC transporter ATP-binding protein [Polyangia bacterium]